MEADIISVRRGRMHVIEMSAGQQLKILSGRIWLTEQGRAQDFILQAGEVHEIRCCGRVLIDAADFALLESTLSAPVSLPVSLPVAALEAESHT